MTGPESARSDTPLVLVEASSKEIGFRRDYPPWGDTTLLRDSIVSNLV